MSVTGLSDILREYSRLRPEGPGTPFARAMALRVVAGAVQGVGLLSLIELSTALASGAPAGGLSTGGWLVVLAVSAGVGAVAIYHREKSAYGSAFLVMRRLHELIGDRLTRLPLGWFVSTAAGRLSRLVSSGAMQVGTSYAHAMTGIVTDTVAMLTLTAGLLWWYPPLGAFLAGCLAVHVLLMVGANHLDLRCGRFREPAAVELAERIVEYARCQGVLRACGRTGARGDGPLAAALTEERRRARILLWAEAGINIVQGMSAQLIAVLMMVLTVSRALSGNLAPLEAVAVVGVGLQVVQYLTNVGEMRMGFLMQAPLISTAAEVLDAPALPEPAASGAMKEPGAVELDDVVFGYEATTPVLRGVSLKIAPCTMTALVGPSGSGKTTVARLIARFWDVDAGSVRVGGTDVRELSTADLMEQLSMVFQDVYLFDDTLEANIRVGRSGADHEEVLAAADLAGVSEIVDRLPEGWATRVGEGGTALSGGERQRVSVARALLKRAPVLLFDEATSALDAQNEANLARAFAELRRRATVLVIAHKLDTIRSADQIVVLDGTGGVAQVGTHVELLAAGGMYKEFWEQRDRARGWAFSR